MMKLTYSVLQTMINNFLEDQYRPSDKVYTHPSTGNSIYLGDIQAAMDMVFLNEKDIQTVVTAASGMEHVSYDPPIKHFVYPLLDVKSENVSKNFLQFYELMEKELVNGSVLVHCAAGISRSSTLVIAYLMRKNNWSFKQAIAFVRTNRPKVLPNLGFERQLKDYQNQLRQNQLALQRRKGSKTSQERKHLASKQRGKILPEIGFMGRTQLKPKVVDILGEQPPIQTSQRSRNSTRDRNRPDFEFYGTRRVTFKPLKSKSIGERRPVMISSVATQESGVSQMRARLGAHGASEVLVQRLKLSEKAATERHLRIKPLHKLAYY